MPPIAYASNGGGVFVIGLFFVVTFVAILSLTLLTYAGKRRGPRP